MEIVDVYISNIQVDGILVVCKITDIGGDLHYCRNYEIDFMLFAGII